MYGEYTPWNGATQQPRAALRAQARASLFEPRTSTATPQHAFCASAATPQHPSTTLHPPSMLTRACCHARKAKASLSEAMAHARESPKSQSMRGGGGKGAAHAHIRRAFDPELSGDPELGVEVGLHHIRFQHLGAWRICTRCDTIRHIQSALANGLIESMERLHKQS